MKTDIDPNFEYKENKEFRKEFFTGLAVIIALAFILALLLLAIAYGEVIDANPHAVIAGIFVCGFLGWSVLTFLNNFKHNDQR